MNLTTELNSVPEKLHEYDGPIYEVDLLLEQNQVINLGLVRPGFLHKLDYLAFHICPKGQGKSCKEIESENYIYKVTQ